MPSITGRRGRSERPGKTLSQAARKERGDMCTAAFSGAHSVRAAAES